MPLYLAKVGTLNLRGMTTPGTKLKSSKFNPDISNFPLHSDDLRVAYTSRCPEDTARSYSLLILPLETHDGFPHWPWHFLQFLRSFLRIQVFWLPWPDLWTFSPYSEYQWSHFFLLDDELFQIFLSLVQVGEHLLELSVLSLEIFDNLFESHLC